MELIVENVMECSCCGGTVDRFGTRESEARMNDYVAHRDDVKYRILHGLDRRPMLVGCFECRDCGAIGDLNTGIMEPMLEKSI